MFLRSFNLLSYDGIELGSKVLQLDRIILI